MNPSCLIFGPLFLSEILAILELENVNNFSLVLSQRLVLSELILNQEASLVLRFPVSRRLILSRRHLHLERQTYIEPRSIFGASVPFYDHFTL